MLLEKDLDFIQELGISQNKIKQQISHFKKGFPALNIIKPAVNKDGIKQLGDKKIDEYIKIYEKASRRLKRVKFVPASGAASRMFKNLYKVLVNYKGTEEDYLKIMSDRGFQSVYYTCQNIKNFAFYDDLISKIEKKGFSIDELSRKKDFTFLLKQLLDTNGLNYSNMPKGLIKFHRTFNEVRTPVYEHLVEGIHYAASGKKVSIHFTVSPMHIELFKKHIEVIVPNLQKKHKVKFDISYSIQKPDTDTVAVDAENNLVYNIKGNLIFRPGGHGALIYNLNEINADLIFIKNIDNIIQDRLKEDTYTYKKALAGLLLNIRKKAAGYNKKLNKKINDDLLSKIEEFVKKELYVIPPEKYYKWDKIKKVEFLLSKINRPIRVCGMVRNEGEPGGGPFWVKAADGSMSLQIVEGSQFNDDQKPLMSKATHFNPVDIICSIKDFKGKKYDLLKFVDNKTGFISTKSVDGINIKVLELPGLWNGAMANWNTIFVEVPVSTFSPVKTINDLLKVEHLFEKDLLQNDDKPKFIE